MEEPNCNREVHGRNCRVHQLRLVLEQLTALVDGGESVPIPEMIEHINMGDLFAWMQGKHPETGFGVAWQYGSDAPRIESEITGKLQEISGLFPLAKEMDGIEHAITSRLWRKLGAGVRRNGLCLLMAWLLTLVERESYVYPFPTSGGSFAGWLTTIGGEEAGGRDAKS